jgi:hypothetical protein
MPYRLASIELSDPTKSLRISVTELLTSDNVDRNVEAVVL